MIDIRTGKDLKELPILEEPKIYIYAMWNSEGKVKIGKTKDIYKRYLSLCGSNGQGIPIHKVYCSEESYLTTLERVMHDKFSKYRIPNTEWFCSADDKSGEVLFDNVVNELVLLFSSTSYKKCNELRRKIHEWNKGGDICDN